MIDSATPPMREASRIRLSWPMSEKLGVYARGEIRAREELARVEPAVGVDSRLVGRERRELVRRQVFELGDADPVLARDDASQLSRERHDPRDGRVRLAQHRIIVRIDREIRMHVAVAGVHVQRDEHPAAQVLALDFDAARHDRRERVAAEDFLERRLQLGLPRRDRRTVLQRRERRIDPEAKDPASARARRRSARGLHPPSRRFPPPAAGCPRPGPTHARAAARRRTRRAHRTT